MEDKNLEKNNTTQDEYMINKGCDLVIDTKKNNRIQTIQTEHGSFHNKRLETSQDEMGNKVYFSGVGPNRNSSR